MAPEKVHTRAVADLIWLELMRDKADDARPCGATGDGEEGGSGIGCCMVNLLMNLVCEWIKE